MRVHLPDISTVINDPMGAIVPTNPEYQIGALGLLAQVALTDCWAAWMYAARLDDEIASAAARALLRRKTVGVKKHAASGRKARGLLLGNIGKDLGA